MSIELEKLMEAKSLPESDREEIRDFHEFLALRAEWRRTGTDEAKRKYVEAIERAGKEGGE